MSAGYQDEQVGKVRDALPEFSAVHAPKIPVLILIDSKSSIDGIPLEDIARFRAVLAFSEIRLLAVEG